MLVEKSQFDEMKQKLNTLEELTAMVEIVGRVNKRAEAADALAFQCFMSMANICDALGLHVKMGASGAIEIGGVADSAPEKLALSLEVMRMRRQRGSGSGL